jgi:hypothetical protein
MMTEPPPTDARAPLEKFETAVGADVSPLYTGSKRG